MATHSSILAWRIPWTEELGGLQSTGLQGAGHNLVTKQQQYISLEKIIIILLPMVKNLPAIAGDIRDMGSIPGWERSPEGGHGHPLQYSCLENPHEQSSLVSYKLRGQEELDMTE